MKVKCEYCRQMIDEGQEKCPYCGATISAVNRVSDKQPKTIEELKEWYTAHNLPPEEKTRFFIGKDIKEPKAFGIYKSTGGDFVVYKNKADGTRAIRYQGVDEGYAVNELYQRLRAEIADQKAHNQAKKSSSGKNNSIGSDIIDAVMGICKHIGLITVIILIIGGIGAALMDKGPSKGYYKYKGNDYYYQNSHWYQYAKDIDDWLRVDDDDELFDNINDDTEDTYSSSWSGGKSFESTSWYDTGSSDDDDDWDSDSYWDDDDDWDSDWDSDWGSDWDSDW